MAWKANIVGFLVAGVIAAALWVSISAIQEKGRLASGTKQILSIVTGTSDLMGKDPGLPVGMDVLKNLYRTGRLSGVFESDSKGVVANPWGKPLTAVMVSPVVIRIETDVPSNGCRQIADLFLNNIKGVKVLGFEVFDRQTIFRQQLIKDKEGRVAQWVEVARACENSSSISIGITISLR